jgi:hypothetical protein
MQNYEVFNLMLGAEILVLAITFRLAFRTHPNSPICGILGGAVPLFHHLSSWNGP